MLEKFNNEENLKQATRTFSIGRWSTQVLFRPVNINLYEKDQLESLALEWSQKFNQNHKNLMTENFSVPSILIRFDYVIDINGDLKVFEIEDRPAGLEINAIANPPSFELFKVSLSKYSEHTNKKIGVCISTGRMFNSDDFFWTQRISDLRVVMGEVPTNPKSLDWLVRTLRDEDGYYKLSPYSLTTIQYEGDKSYGVKMGIWKEIGTELSWDKPFVLKPDAGCRCENVHLYHPKKPGGGYSTRSKIEQAIKNKEVSYIQEYQPPEFPDFLPSEYAMIRRCFLVFDVVEKKYRVIGGLWESRPKCHKIHGANDAICGPLVL